MKISKITKILPLALAFTMCSALAADPEVSSSVNYSVTLNDYIKITSTPALTATSTFADGYTGITITNMSGVFDIISNAKERTLKLEAETVNGADPLYDVTFNNTDKTGTAKLVFAHTTEVPASTSITNITTGGATLDPDKNPNAIAFDVTITHTYDHGPGTISGAWTKGNPITYTMNNGVSKLTYAIGGPNVAKTFNTQDQSGTYKATLKLTDLGAITQGNSSGT